MAKKPAIIATIAATPPFPTKGVAPDVVEVVAAELVAEFVGELAELADPLLDAEPDAEPDALEDPEAPDTEDDAPVALAEPPGVVYETGLGDGVAPVAERPTVEEERIRNQALKKVAKKNRYQVHIVPFVQR